MISVRSGLHHSLLIGRIDIKQRQPHILRHLLYQSVHHLTFLERHERHNRHHHKPRPVEIPLNPPQQRFQVFGELLLQVFTLEPVVYAIPHEDIIRFSILQRRYLLLIPSTFHHRESRFSTTAAVYHLYSRHRRLQCRKLLYHFLQMNPVRLYPSRSRPLRSAVAY